MMMAIFIGLLNAPGAGRVHRDTGEAGGLGPRLLDLAVDSRVDRYRTELRQVG